MATKVIHLEAVSDLTFHAFVAALKIIIFRKAKWTKIFTDNGTNMVGAARKLNEEFLEAIKHTSIVLSEIKSDKMQWYFMC